MLLSVMDRFFPHYRSYGRPPKTAKLKANFVHLSQDMLVDVSSLETYQSASSLHRQPFFHIYWTDCQVRTENAVLVIPRPKMCLPPSGKFPLKHVCKIKKKNVVLFLKMLKYENDFHQKLKKKLTSLS